MARQTAFITGAGSDLGKAVALALAREGWHIVAVLRRGDAASALAEELRRAGGTVQTITANVARRAELEQATELIQAFGGTLRLLLPAAEVMYRGSFTEMNPRLWQEMIEVNLTGLLHTVQATLPFMESGSHILLPGSVTGWRGRPSWAVYGATKAALRSFAEALREELRPRHIHVTLLTIGAVDSPMWNRIKGEWDRETMLKPEHIAPWILHLVEHPEVMVDEIQILPLAGGFGKRDRL